MKQLKRLTSVLLVLGMVLGLMPLSAFAAEPAKKPFTKFTEEVDGNTYTYMPLNDSTVELTGFDPKATAANVEIPSTATSDGKEYSVTSIGTGAFGGRTELTTVILPDSVTSVGAASFISCENLKEVNLGNSVRSIGDNAFMHCTSMEKLTIPKSIEEIGYGAFFYGLNVNKKLEVLHYTGTKAQWDVLMNKEISYMVNGHPYTGTIKSVNSMLDNPKEFHYAPTVSFDCGGKAEGTSKEVLYEGIVTPPAEPTAKGYQFEGWYTQKNGGELFNFNQKITKDVTVYAHWSVKPKPEPKPEPNPNPNPNPNPDAKEYTLTEKDGTLVRVTIEENGATVDITKNVVLKKQGTTQIGRIPAGAMVTVEANAAPEGMVFAQWNISDPALMGDPDVAHTSQTMTFPMPPKDVTIEAMYESAENARETELLGSAAMIGAVGISAVVLAYQAHQLGTELYLKYLLPSGAALPQNRIQLAELLWKNAGEPVPDGNAAYEDIGLNEEATQQAAQWALENELMELPDAEHTGQFKPDERISYEDAIRAWKKAQQLKTAE